MYMQNNPRRFDLIIHHHSERHSYLCKLNGAMYNNYINLLKLQILLISAYLKIQFIVVFKIPVLTFLFLQ